jgi:hypothetical protein
MLASNQPQQHLQQQIALQGLVKQEELTAAGTTLSQQLRQLANTDAANPTKKSCDSAGGDSEKLERALQQMSQVLEDAKEFLKKQKKPLRADGSKAHILSPFSKVLSTVTLHSKILGH